MTFGDWSAGVDVNAPSAARMYDYYLGGSHNFKADREAAEQVIRIIPQARRIAVANRAFLGDAVRYLLGQGIDQFLDVGAGILTAGSVHEIAAAYPGTRVVYVDTDPVAVAHRDRHQIARFFHELEVADPGLTLVQHWRPGTHDHHADGDVLLSVYGGIGRKP